jgi:hypothetical protein
MAQFHTCQELEHLPDNYFDIFPDTPKDRYFSALIKVGKLAKKIRRLEKEALARVSGFGGLDPEALRIACKMATLAGKMARAIALATAEVSEPANAA